MYGEGIYIGYRHYDKADIPPLFPFGHGLSYTTFTYDNVRISNSVFPEQEGDSGSLTVEVDITNTGDKEGKESVQFYVSQTSKSGLPRPVRELKAFDKVCLKPGETKTAKGTLDKYALGYYDEKKASWVVDEGAEFEVYAAASSRDLRGSAKFSVGKGMKWLK